MDNERNEDVSALFVGLLRQLTATSRMIGRLSPMGEGATLQRARLLACVSEIKTIEGDLVELFGAVLGRVP